MTKDDKILLLNFITRTGMYITIQDKTNVVSFVTGYEIGSKTCDFSNKYKDFLFDRFFIKAGATGWPGQIEQLSLKLSQSWLRTFKQSALQLITDAQSSDLMEELDKTIKTRIQGLIERINVNGDPWFNDWWTEEWQSLCSLSFDWFKQLWTADQLRVIQAIDNAVASKNIFIDKDNNLPTNELVNLRGQFKP